MKNVLIFVTTGSANGSTIQISSTTWGDLQEELLERNIQIDNMKAVVGETRVTLESPQAHLPEGDFTLYLMPKKNKSGSYVDKVKIMTFRQLRTEMKNIFAKDPDAKGKYFKNGHKNWTQLSKDDIREKLVKYKKQNSTKEVVEEVVEKVEEVVEEVVEKSEEVKHVVEETKKLVEEKDDKDHTVGDIVEAVKEHVRASSIEKTETEVKLEKSIMSTSDLFIKIMEERANLEAIVEIENQKFRDEIKRLNDEYAKMESKLEMIELEKEKNVKQHDDIRDVMNEFGLQNS